MIKRLRKVCWKAAAVQLMVALVLFCGSAEAKPIESGLWGIGWDANAKAVEQVMGKQGFMLLDQVKDEDGKTRQRFGYGLYAGFRCEIEVVWQAKHLAEINIASAGRLLLGADAAFQNLVARFNEEYGQPREREAHMLKIFPGVWVEGAKWTVSVNGQPSYDVVVVQNRPAPAPQGDPAGAEGVFVSFIKL